MPSDYNVFISAKNLDADGCPTKDRKIAFELWEFLEKRGFRVFFSDVSLECLGVSEYTTTIDDALDQVQVLVVVCSSRAHVDSRWVKYEWESFLNDIRSGNKPDGRVFVYLVDESIRNLPRGLRHTQCIDHGSDGFDRLARFISNATGLHRDAVEAVQTVDVRSMALASEPPDLSGDWEGEWKRDTGSIVHRGRLSLVQIGQSLTAQMRVTFEKDGLVSVLNERLCGLASARLVVLQGESVEYVDKGNSTYYLLDRFELNLDAKGISLEGEFYSKRGRGKAVFRRI